MAKRAGSRRGCEVWVLLEVVRGLPHGELVLMARSSDSCVGVAVLIVSVQYTANEFNVYKKMPETSVIVHSSSNVF